MTINPTRMVTPRFETALVAPLVFFAEGLADDDPVVTVAELTLAVFCDELPIVSPPAPRTAAVVDPALPPWITLPALEQKPSRLSTGSRSDVSVAGMYDAQEAMKPSNTPGCHAVLE